MTRKDATASTGFQRTPVPLPIRALVAVGVYGVAWPAVRILEKLGRAEKVFGDFTTRVNQEIADKNPFRDYVPGKQDVFVMTLPKSGTNWMMQIAHQLIWHGQGEFDHIHNVIPWPDIQAMPRFMHSYAVSLEKADHWKKSPEQKRVIKTHFSWDMLPVSHDARYIAVIRDPKDVFVSGYFFMKDAVYGRAMPSVDIWYKLFLSGRGVMGMSWPEHTAGYWSQRHRPNVLVLSFKSMKRDLRGTVTKVAEFLNMQVTQEILDQVCHRSSFDYMKRIDNKFHMGKIVLGREPGPMIRRGTQGGSNELLSTERQKELDAVCIAELKRRGCDFPYEEFCDLA